MWATGIVSGQRGHRGGQHLEPVAEHHDQIRPAAREGAGEAASPRPAAAATSAGASDAPGRLDPVGDGPAVRLDHVTVRPKRGERCAARHEELEREPRGARGSLEQRDQMAVVRAGDRHDADRARRRHGYRRPTQRSETPKGIQRVSPVLSSRTISLDSIPLSQDGTP